MGKKTSKKRTKSPDLYFSDQDGTNLDRKVPEKNKSKALINHEDFEIISQECSKQPESSLGLSLPKSIKEQYLSSLHSPQQQINLDVYLNIPNEHSSSQRGQSSTGLAQNQKSKPQFRKSRKIQKKNQLQLNEIIKMQPLSENERQRMRKIRTTVNQEKIKIMEHIFPYIATNTAYKGTVLTLKDVAKIVDLGYSTILHKYKDFRLKGQVQKGTLLKSKDIKRKYNKSLALQNMIKKSLNEKNFRTAKQLAQYVSEKYNVNVNRSIISRHLNEMQKQKFQNHKKELRELQLKQNESQKLQMLKSFCKIFLNLKKDVPNFYYFAVIRLYLFNGNVQLELQQKDVNFQIINLVITATDTRLMQYYPYLVNEQQIILAKSLLSLDKTAYSVLYHQLQAKAEDHQLDIQIERQDKVYVIFPYKNSKKQFQYRQRTLQHLLKKKTQVLTIPPPFKVTKINFLLKWFEEEVIPEFSQEKIDCFDRLKEVVFLLMSKKQQLLENYSNEMLTTMSQF